MTEGPVPLHPMRVLLVEDNDQDAVIFRRMLGAAPSNRFDLIHASCLKEGLEFLVKGDIDLALLDLGLPDSTGLDSVRAAHRAAPTVPLIVLTGNEDDQLASDAIKVGAQDYLIKGHLETRVLPRILRYAIERHQLNLKNLKIAAQQSELKDAFLSHVSHELRSPLTAIYQFSTLIMDGLAGETTAAQKDYLKIIVRNAMQLKSMVDDLLEVSQAEAGKLLIETRCSSITDAVDQALNAFRESAQPKQIALSATFGPGGREVCADPKRLRQMLAILLDNAIKFTPPRGTVTVETGVQPEEPGCLFVAVADTGCGVPPQMVEHIFERHSQVPGNLIEGRSGLGLGLFICRELAERQGGKIWVTANPPGSRFSFTLPLYVKSICEEAIPQETLQ